MTSNTAIIIASSVSGFATIIITFYAFMNYRLMKAMKAKDEQYQQQTTDLFQAIVISNVIDRDNTPKNIEKFNERYHGKTVIFTRKDVR